MANQITITNINPRTQLVAATSRYADSQVMYYGALNRMTFNTYKKRRQSTSSNDRYTVVTAGREYRPDLLSYDFYGTPDFWWKIMEANNIKDIYDFKAGINVWLPENIFS